VEIFNLIADYLPRRCIQNLRLASHEFDRKLSGYYFRNVVARFDPQIYGRLDHNVEPTLEEVIQDGKSRQHSIIRNGLRIFNDFGSVIKAFALSLEINQLDLADPPVKLNQEIIKASWGLYRWPLEKYARYTDIESLEDVADETHRMTHAFSKLTNLRELGLSCDAGLGFLVGPNTTSRQARVFRSSRYDPETVLGDDLLGAPRTTTRFGNLRRMVLQAGYNEDEVHDAIKLLLECEGRTAKWTDGDEDGETAQREDTLRPIRGLYADEGLHAIREHDSIGVKRPLEPRNLSAAQKEMLMEMKWAHDALIQSYVISVVDNYDIFSNVTVFSIAQIPSSLLTLLSRADLWQTLVSVREFRLGVIPDWRFFTKSNDNQLADHRISPLKACDLVFNLLQNFVAKQRNIQSVHFEWICGGETGEGLSQRNRYILPAPFTATQDLITDCTATTPSDRLLSLPHVSSLSLKNCWASPQTFLRTIKNCVNASLTHLQLESFSISGPPTNLPQPRVVSGGDLMSHHPWPLCNGAAPDGTYHPPRFQAMHWIGAAAIPPAPPQAQQPALNALNLWPGGAVPVVAAQPTITFWTGPLSGTPVPTFLSWAHLLNELTPGATIEALYPEATEDNKLAQVELQAKLGSWVGWTTRVKKLSSLAMKSCGYVLIDWPGVDNRQILGEPFRPNMAADVPARLREIDRTIMYSNDINLGRIVDQITTSEKNILHYVFGMTIPGHLNEPTETAIDEGMRRDGFLLWGRGRFSGTIVAELTSD
jgi:hypothetical protein